MAITDINISETLEAGAPSIKYKGDMNPNMQMASATDAQQKEADRLWQLELKKMELDEDYIPEIIDPEEMKVASHEANDAWLEQRFEELLELGLSPEAAAEQSQRELREGTGPNLYATGGRAHFGLGSIIKKIGKAAKKVVKSPIGKAAILGGLGMYGMGAGPFAGMRGSGFLKGLGGTLFGQAGSRVGEPFIPYKEGILSKFLPSSGMGKAALLGGIGLTAATAFEGMEEDDVKALRNNPEALRGHLEQYYRNVNSDALAKGTMTDEDVTTWVEQNMYSKGGRVGLGSGANDKFEEKIAALVAKGLSRELAETMVLADISPENFTIIDALETKAQGGKIGFAYGPDQTAQAAGIMGGLPTRSNAAGVKELDLRDSGGFIPPVGVKEKADDIPAMLSNNEFVMTADAVRAAGGGSVEKGAEVMYDQMKRLENKIV